MRRILVVDDEESLRHMLQVFLVREGYEVVSAANAQSALAELDAKSFDCVVSDVRMPEQSGLDLLAELGKREHPPTVIMMSAYGSHELAIDAMRRGAYDYVSKPFSPEEMLLVLRKAEERERLRQENQALRRALAAQEDAPTSQEALCGMVGRGAAMQNVFRLLRKVADHKTTVLITGESGTGKELVARALHKLSGRADGPFVAVNCGAIPETLLESELFGHIKGSFTGASRDKKGLFQEATGGTLFLDEIGEMPLGLQVKLLRAIQEEEIRRVGTTTRSRSTCAWSRPPFATSAPRPRRAPSARTCTTVSTSCPCGCRRCASVPRTSRTWSSTFSSATRPSIATSGVSSRA